MKKQVDTTIMDWIAFGLSIGYLKKIENYITYDSESNISHNDYNRRYKEYCK